MQPADVSVTGVMVTGKSLKRYPLARNAVQAWVDQNYPGPRQLLIINDHPSVPLFPQQELPPHVFEVRVGNEGNSLGALRNLGNYLAQGDYIVQWDDDDHSHPDRLHWQVSQTEQGKASVFKYEVHCDLTNGQRFVNCGKSIRGLGFPGTMLFPADVSTKFPDLGKAEDTEFLVDLKEECGVQTLINDPTFYLRLYHGHNTWSQTHVMNWRPGSRHLNMAETAYVEQVMQQYEPAILAMNS